MDEVGDELKSVEQQREDQIDEGKVKKHLGKVPVPNWKTPGPDQVPGFWLKTFSCLYGRIARQLFIRKGKMPSWMTEARTVWMAKKGNSQVITGQLLTCRFCTNS